VIHRQGSLRSLPGRPEWPIHRLGCATHLPLPREAVFAFFADPANLERITPPELRFRIKERPAGGLRAGSLIRYRLRLLGVSFDWLTEIIRWDPPHEFVDEQRKGPYRLWIHTHTFSEDDAGTSVVDEVRYRLPLWPAGEVAWPLVHVQLRRIFAYRSRALRRELLVEPDIGPHGRL
jgi:ligand-binding SRPBCC domain-containing protein